MAVALHALWLARYDDLSAWLGGGFGMFSTADGWGTRHLHAVALGPAFRTPLVPPPALEDQVARALALPSNARLRALARQLAPQAENEFESPERVRITVFARRYDRGTLAPEGVVLRSLDVPVHPEPAGP